MAGKHKQIAVAAAVAVIGGVGGAGGMYFAKPETSPPQAELRLERDYVKKLCARTEEDIGRNTRYHLEFETVDDTYVDCVITQDGEPLAAIEFDFSQKFAECGFQGIYYAETIGAKYAVCALIQKEGTPQKTFAKHHERLWRVLEVIDYPVVVDCYYDDGEQIPENLCGGRNF